MFFFCIAVFGLYGSINAQTTAPPLVYSVENTGTGFALPVMPALSELPVIEQLPDPFLWTDGSGRDTTFASWRNHRADFKAMIEHYEIGAKPGVHPDSIKATYDSATRTLRVVVRNNGDSLVLSSVITIPENAVAPFPLMIGANGNSLPATIFDTRGIARMNFNASNVSPYGQESNSHPYYRLYPEQNIDNTGQYAIWSWGISRLIDGLERLQDVLPVDLKHIGVTGCSYAGKMALFAGAFDERIALTIAQESGGGGYTTWRVSQTLGAVENLGATDHKWFREDMFAFAGNNVSRLPHDHHQLMAMVAPRALLVTGNPDYVWLADQSGYIGSRATQKIYETLGIGDRFGFSIVAGHNHCAVPASQIPEIEAFVEKFLLGNMETNTLVRTNPYDNVEYTRWFKYWGTEEDSKLPPPDLSGFTYQYYEAECATVGSEFTIESDEEASGGKYVLSPENQQLTVSNDAIYHVSLEFEVAEAKTYYFYARLNCPTADDDSYHIKLDNGSWSMINGLATTGWQWKLVSNLNVTSAGKHTLTICGRENGAKMDKICITDGTYEPESMGGDADNCGDVANSAVTQNGYSLNVNGNPIEKQTSISFEVPNNVFVSLKIYDMLGTEIAELAGKEYNPGNHYVKYSGDNLASGYYVCVLKAGDFSASRKLVKK